MSLSSFQFGTISNTFIDILIHLFWQAYVTISVGYKLKSRISGLQNIHTLEDTDNFPKTFYQLILLPTVYESSNHSTYLLTLGIIKFWAEGVLNHIVDVSHFILI